MASLNLQFVRSQQGFYLLSMTLMIPIIITLLFFSAVQWSYIDIFERGKELCIESIAQAQHDMRQGLKKLERMNPRAKLLRKKRDTAKKSVHVAARSGNPYALAAAKAYQLAVFLEQTQYSLQQKALETTIQVSAFKASKKFIGSLNHILRTPWKVLA